MGTVARGSGVGLRRVARESAHWYVYLVREGCQLYRQVCVRSEPGRALPAEDVVAKLQGLLALFTARDKGKVGAPPSSCD